ncbi:DUF7091 family protein [Halobellus marinus]|uniref:DUF7091 family protein n=1 Tax=Halobellus TaxID=1073986 RepID=UPI0028ACFC83|nr:hypothetical protein [Halobellus sp. DFY28]
MEDRLERLVRQKFREAGRKYAQARDAYREGREESGGDKSASGAVPPSLPRDEAGRVRLVCRRDADKRTVHVDDDGHPECFEAGHPDCEGCVEDVRDGIVETW